MELQASSSAQQLAKRACGERGRFLRGSRRFLRFVLGPATSARGRHQLGSRVVSGMLLLATATASRAVSGRNRGSRATATAAKKQREMRAFLIDGRLTGLGTASFVPIVVVFARVCSADRMLRQRHCLGDCRRIERVQRCSGAFKAPARRRSMGFHYFASTIFAGGSRALGTPSNVIAPPTPRGAPPNALPAVRVGLAASTALRLAFPNLAALVGLPSLGRLIVAHPR